MSVERRVSVRREPERRPMCTHPDDKRVVKVVPALYSRERYPRSPVLLRPVQRATFCSLCGAPV